MSFVCHLSFVRNWNDCVVVNKRQSFVQSGFPFVFQLAEAALAHELVTNEPSALYHTLLARLYIQNENYAEANQELDQALKLNHQVKQNVMAQGDAV